MPPPAQLQASREEQIASPVRIRPLLQLVPNEDVQRPRRRSRPFTLYLEIDGMERFATERDFFSYCRLVPGADNSGGKVRHKRSKEGNRHLSQQRRGACGSVLPEIRAFEQKKARKKNRFIARAIPKPRALPRQAADRLIQFKGPLSRIKQSQWPRRSAREGSHPT